MGSMPISQRLKARLCIAVPFMRTGCSACDRPVTISTWPDSGDLRLQLIAGEPPGCIEADTALDQHRQRCRHACGNVWRAPLHKDPGSQLCHCLTITVWEDS